MSLLKLSLVSMKRMKGWSSCGMEGGIVRVNSVLLSLSLSGTFWTLSLFSFIFKGLELVMVSC